MDGGMQEVEGMDVVPVTSSVVVVIVAVGCMVQDHDLWHHQRLDWCFVSYMYLPVVGAPEGGLFSVWRR